MGPPGCGDVDADDAALRLLLLLLPSAVSGSVAGKYPYKQRSASASTNINDEHVVDNR